jgi:alpha-glucosidase
VLLCLAQPIPAQEQPQRKKGQLVTRRAQRVLPLPTVEVASPAGALKFTLLPNPERLTFTVTRENTTVIEPSPLTMSLDGYDLSSGVVLSSVERYVVDKQYPWHGAHRTATNRCHGAKLVLQHDLGLVDYTLEIRVFDDGVAYRHVIPGEGHATRVPDERSVFVVPAGASVWYHGLARGHYEAEYVRQEAGEVRAGEWAGPPLTFKLPGAAGYAAITEADLVNYSGMGLESDGRRGWLVGLGHRHPLNYPFELRYGREEGRRLGRPAAITGTITTPWRVVLAGKDLNTLVNSTVLPNLCPPPDSRLFPEGIHTPWVKPGRAVWRYVDGGPGGLDGMKEFSRMAGELGFEHHVIEGFWSRWSPAEAKAIVDFSRERGVGLWFWKHSNELRTPEAREEFFKMLQEFGVSGAKIDFFDHEHKELVDLYEALLRQAAEHGVCLVFHGASKPTGRERTWPNDMVREAVLGMESSSLRQRARHQTILPFTRYLAGPADYTTMIFSQRRADTTWANQIASLAIFASPLLTIAANPHSILTNPAVNVIKTIPAVWDETIVLPGSEIGELAAYARRKGETWFVAAMAGPQARSVQVPLAFLGPAHYQASVVRDGATDASVIVEPATKTRNDLLNLELRAGGGYVARFTRQ